MTAQITEISDDKLERMLSDAQKELTNFREALKVTQRWCNDAYKKWEVANEEMNRRILERGCDVSVILQAYPESKVMYDSYNALMRKYNLGDGGYWKSTKQRVVKVMFTEDDSDKNINQINGLKVLMPYITPIDKVDDKKDEIIVGCKPFDIFENTCSENGNYHFYVRPDNTVILATTRYYSTKYKELGDFDTAMKYIQKHHWYSKD